MMQSLFSLMIDARCVYYLGCVAAGVSASWRRACEGRHARFLPRVRQATNYRETRKPAFQILFGTPHFTKQTWFSHMLGKFDVCLKTMLCLTPHVLDGS